MIDWPVVIKYEGEDELQYIGSESEWAEEARSATFKRDDILIDSQGHIFSLKADASKTIQPVDTNKTVSMGQMTRHSFLFSILGVTFLLFFGGCSSIARVSDFPMTNKEINFLSPSLQTEYGWFAADLVFYELPVQAVFDSAGGALMSLGYSITMANLEDGVVIGERTMTMTEWKTVGAIYFKEMDGGVRIKIVCKITQGMQRGPKTTYAHEIAASLRKRVNFRQ